MVDNKAVVVLVTLMINPDLSLYELTLKTKFSLKEIKECIETINHFLTTNGYGALIKSHSGYRIPLDVRRDTSKIVDILNQSQVYLPQNDRVHLIYLYTFCRRDFVSNNHYQDFLKVSKNTTLADIKALRDMMTDYNLELRYTRTKGYCLVGDELSKHRMAIAVISSLLKSSFGLWALDYVLTAWSYPVSYEDLAQRTKDYYHTFHMTPIIDRLAECLYSIIFIICRYQRDVQHVFEEPLAISEQLMDLTTLLVTSIEQQMGQKMPLSAQDCGYFSLLLAACFEGEGEFTNAFFHSLTEAIIDNMQEISILQFKNREELTENVQRHLIPAYYRLRYGLPNDNTYTERIKKNYSDLFALVKESLQPLSDTLGFALPDSEVAYFVLHFGGYLKKAGSDSHKKAYTAVIICPNGLSSSLIIKENLRLLFPNITFRGISRIDQLKTMSDSCYDMIFSTVAMTSKKPSYLVSMTMTDDQSYQLMELVHQDFPEMSQDLEIEQLVKVISQYATVSNEKELRFALRTFLRQNQKRKDNRPLLHEFITEKTYQVSSQRLNWKDAIRLSAQPLLDSGQILSTYPEAMISKVEEFGPFINLGSGIAIPHARPEDGVQSVGMSMLVLENPIYLLDDPKQEIYLLICIAAIDNETHLKALSHLTTILRDKENVNALITSRSYQDIKEIIKQEA